MATERLGHPEEAALTLGRALAGASAQAKARRLGNAEEQPTGQGGDEQRAAQKDHDRWNAPARTVRLLGREIAVAAGKGGAVLALDK